MSSTGNLISNSDRYSVMAQLLLVILVPYVLGGEVGRVLAARSRCGERSLRSVTHYRAPTPWTLLGNGPSP